MMSKTIFISLPFPMSARNFLRNRFYDYMSEKFRLVIFSDFSNDNEFISEFKKENVYFEPLIFDFKKNISDRLIFKIYRFGDRYYFTHNKMVHDVPLQRILREKFGNRVDMISRIIGKLFILFPFVNTWIRRYVRRLYISSYYQGMIDKYDPSLVFSTHPFVDSDIQMVINAKHRGIPSMSMIHSWDNLTGKGRVLSLADYMVVWNDIMREEVFRLYPGFKKKNVFVVGIPQHDYIVNDDWLIEKDVFLRSIGADPSRRVITYISRGGKYSNYKENDNINAILEALQNNRFKFNCQMIIREVHLIGRTQYRKTLGPKPYVVYDVPDLSYHPTIDNRYKWNNSPASLYHLGNLLKHSDVIVNYGSTITLDSVYFDKPNIWPIYQWENVDSQVEMESGKHELENSHLQPVLNTNAVRIATSPDDLVDLINDELIQPKRYSKQRKALRVKYNPFHDGNAGLRIAQKLEWIADECKM